MKPILLSISMMCLFCLNKSFGQYDVEYLQGEYLRLREEKARIEVENIQLRKSGELKDDINQMLRNSLSRKDTLIRALRRNLDEANSLIEKQRARIEIVEELKSKDSIRHIQELIDIKNDLQELATIYEETVRDFENDLRKLHNLLFDKTFSVTATLNEACAVCPKRPTGRVELDEGNSINIKSNQINAIYIEFSTGKTDVELPSYYFTLMVYPDNKGQQPYKLYEDYPIVTQNGEMNHQIEINNKSRIVSGRYVLTLTYEEDEQSIKKERVFTLR